MGRADHTLTVPPRLERPGQEPVSPHETEREGYAPPRLLVAGGAALAVAMGIGRFAYTPILPAMEAAAHLDTNQAGLLASANYAGYLAGALATAIIPRAARGRVLVVSLLAVVVTTALMAGTTSLAAWGVIRFLSGLASAGVFVLASGIVLDALRRQGRASLAGWLFSGVGVGIALSGAVVRVAGGALGWRGEWLALALIAAVALYPSWRWLPLARGAAATTTRARPITTAREQPITTAREQPITTAREQPITTARERPILSRAVRAALALLLLAYLLEGLGYIVTGTFLVAIVERMPGLGGFGPSVWIVVGLAAAPSGVLWAGLAARIGYARALALAYVVQACGIGLPLLGGAGAALLSAVLFGGTFIGISTLTLTLAGQITPRRSAGLIGLLTAAFGLGQIAGPLLAGVLAGHTHNFGPALTAAAAIVLLGGILMAALQPFDPSR